MAPLRQLLFSPPLQLGKDSSPDNLITVRSGRVTSGIRLNCVGTEERTMLDGSAAPTAPEGSSGQDFSPVMRPLVRPVEGEANGALAVNGTAVTSADSQSPVIRTICCVGAGYVGMLSKCSSTGVFAA